jgi:hypothetical protein
MKDIPERINTVVNALSNNQELLTVLESFVETYKNPEPSICLSCFSEKKLGILEVLVKYLKENLFLKYHEIAVLLHRDDRTIWATYQKAKQKCNEKFASKKDVVPITISIFSDRRLGPLEVLVLFLKEQLDFGFNQISKALNRDYHTIWLSYQHGVKKRMKSVKV